MAKRGRPSKYRKEYCQMLIDHMANGGSFESFAALIPDNKVNRDTIYDWCAAHPEFLDAKKRGVALNLLWFEKIGNAGMVGKIKGFNTVTWYMQMKNRHGWKDVNHNINTEVTPQLIIKYKSKKQDGES